MLDIDYFTLIHEHLEETSDKNILDYLLANEQYQKSSKAQRELYEQLEEEMGLTKEQEALQSNWMDATHATGAAYAIVLFR